MRFPRFVTCHAIAPIRGNGKSIKCKGYEIAECCLLNQLCVLGVSTFPFFLFAKSSISHMPLALQMAIDQELARKWGQENDDDSSFSCPHLLASII